MSSRCTAERADHSFCDGPVPDGSPITLCLKHLRIAADWACYLDQRPVRPISRPCPSCGAADLKVTLAQQAATCGSCGVVWRPAHTEVAAAEREAGVVYYIRFADRVKIGTTTNLARRLAGLPHDEVLATEPGGPAVEGRRHQQFAEARVPGLNEWFYRSTELLDHIASLQA